MKDLVSKTVNFLKGIWKIPILNSKNWKRLKFSSSGIKSKHKRFLWRITLVTSAVFFVVLTLVSYRDAVQVAANRFYAPSTNPSGQEFKVGWNDTWSFLSTTTLKRIQCKFHSSQECSFLKPTEVPSEINTNFYKLISSETQLNAAERSLASLGHLEDGTLLILSKSGLITFYNPVKHKEMQQLDLNIDYLGYNPGTIRGPLAGVDESAGLGLRDFDIFNSNGKVFLNFSFLSLSSQGCLAMNLYKVELLKDDKQKWRLGKLQKIWASDSECIKFKEAHLLGSGGKITRYSNDSVILTLGDLNLIDRRKTNSVWGNTVLIKESSGNLKIFTKGHRNPSGIIKLNSGLVIGTEQGPQGGDEINLLEEGKDYGWPLSSYGMNYSYGGYKHIENSHLFGTKPLVAFVPSPAFSSISSFKENPPKYWSNEKGETDIYVSSLKAASIYRCRLNSDSPSIPYCEKIFVGQRIRDITSLKIAKTHYIFLLTERSSIVSFKVTRN